MAELPIMPTADHVATALVAAARAYDENPEAVFLGWPARLPKMAACAALCIAFPCQGREKLARFLNHRKSASPASMTRTYLVTPPFGWRHEAVNAALAALGLSAVTPEEAAAPRPSKPPLILPQHVIDDRPAPPSLQARFASKPLSPMARVTDRRPTGPVDMGDPAPGRSALDQGYSPGSGLAHERGSR